MGQKCSDLNVLMLRRVFVPQFWRSIVHLYKGVPLHDDGATFIPGRDEKLHRVYIKPCLLGCESYSAVN